MSPLKLKLVLALVYEDELDVSVTWPIGGVRRDDRGRGRV